jgi:hypothetical protein
MLMWRSILSELMEACTAAQLIHMAVADARCHAAQDSIVVAACVGSSSEAGAENATCHHKSIRCEVTQKSTTAHNCRELNDPAVCSVHACLLLACAAGCFVFMQFLTLLLAFLLELWCVAQASMMLF